MVIVDASIAAKWLFSEELSAEAVAFGMRQNGKIAPSLIRLELYNTIWKRLRSGVVDAAMAKLMCERCVGDFEEIMPIESLGARASAMMIELAHPIYDCLYLALAERERLPLITVDKRLIEAGRRLASVDVVHLLDFQGRDAA
jgi:predicted nucleic acid-binding protein